MTEEQRTEVVICFQISIFEPLKTTNTAYQVQVTGL